MKQRLLFLFSLLLFSYSAKATHIVGGEFELQHIVNYNYRLTMNLYNDLINGNPLAVDQDITVYIFSKKDNRLLMHVPMSIRSRSNVNYTNIDCTIGGLRTGKVVYDQVITLSPNVFNDPAGYYISWERCCRNSTINNIMDPGGAAQTFYMEFPAVIQNGIFFKNSSPRLFPPLSDYACVGELFYFDFNGTDPDGDSLVYEMITPLNGFTHRDAPVGSGSAAPYPTIKWLSGYNQETQIKGNPAINIDRQTGRLIMRPSSKGLFVFGIRVEEYRNKKKIGEVRRDFQVLVLDCPKNETPVIVAREQGSNQNYQQSEVMRIDAKGNRCINILFTDPDINEFVSLKVMPVNFSSTDYTLSGTLQGMINNGSTQDTLRATVCFSECFSTKGGIYKMDLIVQDDGCSLPRQDTVRVSFIIDPVPDEEPTLSLSTPNRIFTVGIGDKLDFNVRGADADGSVVSLSARGVNFDLQAMGASFTNQTGPAEVQSPFSWDIECETIKQESYQVEFTVTSEYCGETKTIKEIVEVRTKYENNVPVISSDQQSLVIDLKAGEPFEAKIFGNDIDKHILVLSANGEGFDLASRNMTFTSTGGAGRAEGIFKWVATCESAEGSVTKVVFNLSEEACISSPNQILMLEFRVTSPNTEPEFTSDKPAPVYELELNEEFEVNLLGEDIDLNYLTIEAAGVGFNMQELGMTFTATPGNGNAIGKFNWVANCLGAGVEELMVNFTLKEEACNPSTDKILPVVLKVKVPELADFIPPNIFTPNGDGLNDVFEIPSLPSDFCSSSFANIIIYNRWGIEVFRSTDTNFKWTGKGMNDGVYFYVIDFKTSKYKGSVTMVR